ncbi:MAG TPA: protein-disulfide reductase DsbD [Burkholderiales bacterium]|nr:protein-disulfide reductase DsbD [Burkholderiales bacterium]
MLRLLAFLLAFAAGHAAAAVSPQDLLEPDQAFRFSARAVAKDAIEVQWQVAPGYYMYRERIKFAAQPENVVLGSPDLPPGKLKKDEFFGETQTYRGEVRVRVPVKDAAGIDSITLVANSQGCADSGVCYVPHEQKAQINLASLSSAPPTGATGGGFPAGVFSGPATTDSGDDTVIARLFEGSVAVLLLAFFAAGLGLSFTPCVLPMIPILSGIIAGGAHAHPTRIHSFLLSAAYVLGMAITYAIAGVLAGLSGAMLSAALQNAWVLGAFALVFVLLAGSMFGFYELQLPTAMQSSLSGVTNRLPGGRFLGVFGMGVLSALIVGPCVAAPLAAALLYISRTGDVVLGGSALFVMALGMGVPLLAVGASAGALLPKAGAWMEAVKKFFGVLLLGLAIYLVSPVIPVAVQMLLWAALLAITGIYLRALDALPTTARPFDRFAKGVGLLVLVTGIAFLIGALSGSRDILQPLSGLRGGGGPAAQEAPVAFQRIASTADLDRVVAEAGGKPVMLDFYADWCVSCKEMERYTFTDPAVKQRLDGMITVQADVTANSGDHQKLLQRFKLFGPPGIIFFGPDGRELTGVRVVGFLPAPKFTAVLDRVVKQEPQARLTP